jgi:hypothetical protein
MAEDVTTLEQPTTQPTEPVVEENGSEAPQTQPEGQETQTEGTDENSNEQSNGTEGEGNSEPQQPTVEQLQAKIKEYEVRDEEEAKLKEALGLRDVDTQTYNLMNMDQQIVNEGKQVYLRLCNEYGIDANPSKIDESVRALKEKDPAKGYEFERRFEQLGNEVVSKRQAVQQQNTVYEVNKFQNDYGKVLEISPAIKNVMAQYVGAYAQNTVDMYNQLSNVMGLVLPIYQEAFEAGKSVALQGKAKADTSGVQGGVATQNTSSYSSGHTFTREQIKRMSPEEFAKYETTIMQQMREGKIQ